MQHKGRVTAVLSKILTGEGGGYVPQITRNG